MLNGVRELIRNPQGARLQAEIDVALAAGEQSDLLTLAGAAYRRRAYDEGWRALERHQLAQIDQLSETERAALSYTLRAQATGEKWTKWRADAVVGLLDKYDAGTSDADRSAWLQKALEMAPWSDGSSYRALHLLRRYQTLLLLTSLIPLALLVWGVIAFSDANGNDLSAWWVGPGAALAGALGGIISALQRSTKVSTSGPVPARFESFVASLSRPMIGAVAGLTVYFALRAGISVPQDHAVAYLMLYAFGAGFTERLIVRNAEEEKAPAEEAAPAPLPDTGAGAAPPPASNGDATVTGDASTTPSDASAPTDATLPADEVPTETPAPADGTATDASTAAEADAATTADASIAAEADAATTAEAGAETGTPPPVA
jgi:hypothetical protein